MIHQGHKEKNSRKDQSESRNSRKRSQGTQRKVSEKNIWELNSKEPKYPRVKVYQESNVCVCVTPISIFCVLWVLLRLFLFSAAASLGRGLDFFCGRPK